MELEFVANFEIGKTQESNVLKTGAEHVLTNAELDVKYDSPQL